MVQVRDWLLSLPVLERNPFGGRSNESIYAVQVAIVYMDYRTYKKRDPQVGFVFGVDSDRRTLYLSRYSLEEPSGLKACDSCDLCLDTKFIDEVEILKSLE